MNENRHPIGEQESSKERLSLKFSQILERREEVSSLLDETTLTKKEQKKQRVEQGIAGFKMDLLVDFYLVDPKKASLEEIGELLDFVEVNGISDIDVVDNLLKNCMVLGFLRGDFEGVDSFFLQYIKIYPEKKGVAMDLYKIALLGDNFPAAEKRKYRKYVLDFSLYTDEKFKTVEEMMLARKENKIEHVKHIKKEQRNTVVGVLNNCPIDSSSDYVEFVNKHIPGFADLSLGVEPEEITDPNAEFEKLRIRAEARLGTLKNSTSEKRRKSRRSLEQVIELLNSLSEQFSDDRKLVTKIEYMIDFIEKGVAISIGKKKYKSKPRKTFVESSEFIDKKSGSFVDFDNLIKKGDLDGADKILDEGLQEDPDNLELLKAKFRLSSSRGQMAKAVLILKKLKDILPHEKFFTIETAYLKRMDQLTSRGVTKSGDNWDRIITSQPVNRLASEVTADPDRQKRSVVRRVRKK